MELKDSEMQFLDFYICNGLNPAKRIECYKMAFTKSEGLQDTSIETYAKTILASSQAKEYINKRKITNSTSTFQLMESIRYLDRMLKEEELKPLERIQVLKERRISINDLSKLIEVINPIEKDENEFIATDWKLEVIHPEKANDLTPEEAYNFLQPSMMNRIICVCKDGTIKTTLTGMSNANEKFLKALDNGDYRIGMKRKDLEEPEVSKSK